MQSVPKKESAAAGSVRVRILYAELLLSYPRETISGWLRDWVQSTATEDVASYVEKLWDGVPEFDFNEELSFFTALDRLLTHMGADAGAFADRAFRRFAEQPSLSARSVLKAFKPYMPQFFTTHDQRQLLLKLLSPMYESSSSDLRLVYQSIRYGWRRDLVLYQPRGEAIAESGRLDFSRYRLRELAYMPLVLGLPAYEETRLWTDLRDPSAILAAAGYKGEMPESRQVSMSSFLLESGLDFSLAELPSAQGTLFTRDLIEPETGRVLLKAGCLYGVPCALAEFRYQTALGKVTNPFERLVTHMVEPEYSLWNQLRERHELLIEELRSVVEVVYHRGDDSISVGSHHLMRNVPAKILRNVLREFAQTGRAEFENREFKRDTEICMDPLNPNFEGRLNRVIEHLHRIPGLMDIEKVRRGGFRFRALRPLRYREED